MKSVNFFLKKIHQCFSYNTSMNNDFLPAITSLWQVLWEGNFLIQKKTFIVEMSIFLESFPGKTKF